MNTLLTTYIENAASHYPQNNAICIDNQCLTYADYLKKVRQLANQFIKKFKISSSDRICIFLPKCFDLYITIFATLFAGASYVPIEYILPIKRFGYILLDSKAKILISTYKKIKYLIENKVCNYEYEINGFEENETIIVTLHYKENKIFIDEIFPKQEISNVTEKVEQISIKKENLAYLLYTSGTTGKPKGIVHSHQTAVPFIEWASTHLNLGQKDILSQQASISFDLSVFDIFSAVKVGATLVPIPDYFYGNVIKICDFIKKNQISVWYSTPSVLLRELNVQAWEFLKTSKLKHIIFAGEPIPTNMLIQFSNYLPPSCQLYNWYGPTETNVCTHHIIVKEDLILDNPIPIGNPCPYCSIKILPNDSNKTDQNTGILFVNSESTMIGYWNNDERTLQSFASLNTNAKYYDTGDKVHYDSEKRLIFDGRNDRQIKINGHRVQLEEIEHALQTFVEVFEAAVIYCNNIKPSKLVAFVVIAKNQGGFLEKINEKLNKMLPSYMRPEIILEIEKLPRNTRNKIDYETLIENFNEYNAIAINL